MRLLPTVKVCYEDIMAKQSAGILLYRLKDSSLEILLVHPGGPFFAKKDLGAWSIPKGEFQDGEDPTEVAKRELQEETGYLVDTSLIPLTEIKQKGGKKVLAWAAEGDFDPSVIKSNTFSLEWPPRSGRMQEFPEVDKAEWFSVSLAKQKINPNQSNFIEELLSKLNLKDVTEVSDEAHASDTKISDKDDSQQSLF